MVNRLEFITYLEEYIELHAFKNGTENDHNRFLKNVQDILKKVPTKFYLSVNDYDIKKLKNAIMTFLEQDPQIMNDKELDYVRNILLPSYERFINLTAQSRGVVRE